MSRIASMFVLLLLVAAYLVNGVLGWGKRPDASKPYVQLAAPDQIRTLILWTCVCIQCVARVDGSEILVDMMVWQNKIYKSTV